MKSGHKSTKSLLGGVVRALSTGRRMPGCEAASAGKTSVMDDSLSPRRPFPTDVVHPTAVDAAQRSGPSAGRARGRRWRRSSFGLYVPRSVRLSPEQRIVEVAAAMPPGAMLTGWAALRVFGGGFFDGSDAWSKPAPVPVLVEADKRLSSSRARRVLRDRALPQPVLFEGLWCAPPERAVIDAMRLADSGRDAVVALDMALAAGLVSVAAVRRAWSGEIRRVGSALVRFGLRYAHDRSRSPAETRLRLVWLLDARLPSPLVNPEVRDRRGRVIGAPDLLDPRSGLVAEYDGASHRGRDRHRVDNTRRERFLQAGLEPVTVVAGEPVAEVVRRLHAARRRALRRSPTEHQWMYASEEREREISA
ncbi:hypothetical protein [Nocardioides sp.]|uniref:hypothetical protein n=1 Tax=Nocardioides sp. TaxID=35761 RepID=UPI00352891D8